MSAPAQHQPKTADHRPRLIFKPEMRRPHESRIRLASAAPDLLDVTLGPRLQVRHDQPKEPAGLKHLERVAQGQLEVTQRQMLKNMRGVNSSHGIWFEGEAFADVAISDFPRKSL